mmetsp:Transcript_28148/g.36310  ORF Transcript_28148/g.36310 Transcript_28148/m.36310 type:complete len:265 (+) Transcript_28148:1347-2141(+)
MLFICVCQLRSIIDHLGLSISTISFETSSKPIQHFEVFIRFRESLNNTSMVLLHSLRNRRPELGAALDQSEKGGNSQVGNGGGVTVAELGVFEERIKQHWEVFIAKLLKVFLRLCLINGDSEHDVCNVIKRGIEGRVLPITNKINLSPHDGILGVVLLPTLKKLAEGTHTSTRFPNGSFVAPKFEGRAAVAWVHGDELLGSCLAHGIDNLETLVFKSESLDNSENAMAVGGNRKDVKLHLLGSVGAAATHSIQNEWVGGNIYLI